MNARSVIGKFTLINFEYMRRFILYFSVLIHLAQCVALSSTVYAAENAAALTDSQVDLAYKDCKFSFDAPNNPVLLSTGSGFSYSREIYRGSFCVVTLKAPMMEKFATYNDAEYDVKIPINIKRGYYLPGYDRCEGKPGYDVCQEEAFFKFNGFQKDNKGMWRMLPFIPQSGFGISLEQSLSSVLDETIENVDGLTVVGEWEHPYAFYKQPERDILSLFIARKTRFGYVTLGWGDGMVIPLGDTPESRAEARALVNQIIRVVQSIRLEIIN